MELAVKLEEPVPEALRDTRTEEGETVALAEGEAGPEGGGRTEPEPEEVAQELRDARAERDTERLELALLLARGEPDSVPDPELLNVTLGLPKGDREGLEERLSVGEVEMLPLPQALPLPPPGPPS